MTSRAIYRWKSFWLGVLVLVFLGWAWMRSRSQWESAMWVSASAPEYVAVLQGGGQLGFGTAVNRGYPTELRIDKIAIDWPLVWFPPWYADGCEITVGEHMVAHWFVMLVFLVIWASWLGWRWRRIRRLERKIETSTIGC